MNLETVTISQLGILRHTQTWLRVFKFVRYFVPLVPIYQHLLTPAHTYVSRIYRTRRFMLRVVPTDELGLEYSGLRVTRALIEGGLLKRAVFTKILEQER